MINISTSTLNIRMTKPKDLKGLYALNIILEFGPALKKKFEIEKHRNLTKKTSFD